jgi:hypothetical protein
LGRLAVATKVYCNQHGTHEKFSKPRSCESYLLTCLSRQHYSEKKSTSLTRKGCIMSNQSPAIERVNLRKLLWVGPLTIVAAVIAVLVIRVIAVTLLNPSPAFSPLGWTQPIIFTIAGVTCAVFTFAIVGRVARRPIRVFHIVAFVALLFSFIPDVLLLVMGSQFRPGTGLPPGEQPPFAATPPAMAPFPDVTLPAISGTPPADGFPPQSGLQGGPPFGAGVTLPNVLAFITMHVAAYVVSVSLLTRLTREPVT